MHRLWILVLVTVLAGCSSQDDAPDTVPQASPQSSEADDSNRAVPAGDAASIEELSRQELKALGRDPEALREMMRDPAHRAAVRERMRELRQARADEAEGPDRQGAMRERAEQYRSSAGESEGGEARGRERRAPWWEQEAIAQALGLTEAQVTRISEAHADMMDTARRSRQQLAQAVGGLQEALADQDRERLEELIDARVAALDERARSEAEWTRRLFDILDDEQLHKLAQEHPGLMSALLSPVR